MIKNQKKGTAQLLELIEAHPDLPIVPLVTCGIGIDDDCCAWIGTWENARVEKQYQGKERVYSYDEYDTEDALIDAMGWDWFDDASEEECREQYRALPWEEVIAVYISLP